MTGTLLDTENHDGETMNQVSAKFLCEVYLLLNQTIQLI